MPKQETLNKYNNLLKKIRYQNYKTKPYKTQNSYYRNSTTYPKNIICENGAPFYLFKHYGITNTQSEEIGQIENEKREKKEKIFFRNNDKGNLPSIKGKSYNLRNNEIKTYNKKDRKVLEKLYGKSQKINKIRNNSYIVNSRDNLGIRYKDRINYLYNNYVDIRASKGLIGRKHIKKDKGKLNIFDQIVKKHINKNYKFSFAQNNCSICLEKFLEEDNIRYLPCLHLFHGNCISEWLKRKKDCPICKYKIV
jgi:hypothetical protein